MSDLYKREMVAAGHSIDFKIIYPKDAVVGECPFKVVDLEGKDITREYLDSLLGVQSMLDEAYKDQEYNLPTRDSYNVLTLAYGYLLIPRRPSIEGNLFRYPYFETPGEILLFLADRKPEDLSAIFDPLDNENH